MHPLTPALLACEDSALADDHSQMEEPNPGEVARRFGLSILVPLGDHFSQRRSNHPRMVQLLGCCPYLVAR